MNCYDSTDNSVTRLRSITRRRIAVSSSKYRSTLSRSPSRNGSRTRLRHQPVLARRPWPDGGLSLRQWSGSPPLPACGAHAGRAHPLPGAHRLRLPSKWLDHLVAVTERPGRADRMQGGNARFQWCRNACGRCPGTRRCCGGRSASSSRRCRIPPAGRRTPDCPRW
jgi:hypothetical protein